jgi:hypothetical protein
LTPVLRALTEHRRKSARQRGPPPVKYPLDPPRVLTCARTVGDHHRDPRGCPP